MDPPPGFVSQGPQNHQLQLPMPAASNNPQAQLNSFVGNGLNNLNQPPFMPGAGFPNGTNIAAFNALMMQSGLMGIQSIPCHPPNFNPVAGLPFQGQFFNAPQNLNHIAGPQYQGQFNMQGLWPQSFPPNMNPIMCLLQGQMNSQNAVSPMNSILSQQCSTNPFGSSQPNPSNNHMFSQYMAASPSPNNLLFAANAVQLQAMDQQRSTAAIPQNSHQNLQPQFGHPPQLQQNPNNAQRCQEIRTEKSDDVLNANLGKERQTFTPSPRGNWKKGSPQTRFLNPRPPHMTNGRGGTRPFHRNRGDGTRNWTERKPNAETFDKQPREPRRRLALSYTEEEVRQWREARRKNYPTVSKIAKKLGEGCPNSAVNDEDVKARRKQLRDILAKQAELGVEVAELPHNYLSDQENQYINRDYRNKERGKSCNRNDRFQNRFNKRGRADRDNRYTKRHKPMNGEFPAPIVKRSPTLLQKLLSTDVKKDKSKLLQVFRFITLNSFFEHLPERTLLFPQVTAKDAPFHGDTDVGAHSGLGSRFDACKAEENISVIETLTVENGGESMNRDVDIVNNLESDDSSDDSSEDDVSELSEKSEEGEI